MPFHAYRPETDRKKLMIEKAELIQGQLLFVVEALRLLREDEHLLTLPRTKGLDKARRLCAPLHRLAESSWEVPGRVPVPPDQSHAANRTRQ